jgi:hypothetical protein
VVEKANHSAAQRWRRTHADDVTPVQAQQGVDVVAARLDGRVRRRDGQRTTVEALADAEALHPLPLVAFPAELVVIGPSTSTDATAPRRAARVRTCSLTCTDGVLGRYRFGPD